MTIPFLVLGTLAAWVLYRALARSQASPTPPQGAPEVVPLSVTSDGDESSDPLPVDEERDAWEGSFWEVTQPLPARARLRIGYTDGAGRQTERTVDVRQFGAIGASTLVIGHCHLRDATRTFRSDRIHTCVDEDTGEVVRDVREYLQAKYDESPDKTADQLLEGEFDALRVLLYVGKSDGQFRAAERVVIRDVCVALSNDTRLTEHTISDLLARMDVPTMQAFKIAVGRLANRDSKGRTVVMAAAERIVATQKAVHPAEQDALEYMRRRLLSDASSIA